MSCWLGLKWQMLRHVLNEINMTNIKLSLGEKWLYGYEDIKSIANARGNDQRETAPYLSN